MGTYNCKKDTSAVLAALSAGLAQDARTPWKPPRNFINVMFTGTRTKLGRYWRSQQHACTMARAIRTGMHEIGDTYRLPKIGPLQRNRAQAELTTDDCALELPSKGDQTRIWR
jgi:hypothetical protein